MEENEAKMEGRTFTEKEVMEIIDKVQKDCNMKLAQSNNVLTRLNFLFKVVELKGVFSTDFYCTCAQEIEEIMTLKNPEETTEEEK